MTEPAVIGTEGSTRYVPSDNCPPPHPHPHRPSLRLPAGACDAHCHIFGPGMVFPYAPERTFTPHDVPKEQLAALHALLGFSRSVVVQSACNGTDHSVLLDALAAAGDRMRGVALLDDRTTRDEVERLHAAGVRGFRLNYLPHLRTPPTPQEIAARLQLVADLDWHAEVHVEGQGVVESSAMIRSLPGRVVIDHLGRVDLREGPAGPAVVELRRLLDTGGVWVKLSGIDRVSLSGEPWDDAVELAAELLAHAPDRVLWGTDFPHPNIGGVAPDDGLLVDRLFDIAPSDALRQRLLVDNPTEFFDFPV